MTGTVAAILGAGLSARFGAGKLDAWLHGQPLGLWPMRVVEQLGIPFAYVVGLEPPRFLSEPRHAARLIANADPGRGLSSSLALAAGYARGQGAQRLLILLGDMPGVRLETLQRLIGQTPADGITACRYPDHRLGPPACFSAAFLASLERLEGDSGARDLLREGGKARGLRVAAHELSDVDTPADLAELNRLSPPG